MSVNIWQLSELDVKFNAYSICAGTAGKITRTGLAGLEVSLIYDAGRLCGRKRNFRVVLSQGLQGEGEESSRDKHVSVDERFWQIADADMSKE